MCGIAGVLSTINLSTRSKKEVESLLHKISHRGPDDSGTELLSNACIGANRLAIVDKKNGHQPITSKCTNTAIAFNGEIYNYHLLKSKLKNKHYLQTNTDTEILLHLFEENKIKALNMLNGMFAFCITDNTYSYLVRDRLGIKPLYYKFKNNNLYFASEAKCLIDNNPKMNIESTYQEFETNINNETLFKGIFELPPGSYLIFNSKTGKYKIKSYYRLPTNALSKISEKEAIKKFKLLLENAVKIRTSTDLSYGIYVSGGIDSTIISILSKPRLLFTSIVKEKRYLNESKYIKIVEKLFGKKLIKLEFNIENFKDYFVEMVHSLDFPTTSLAAFTEFALAKEVSKYKFRIMLNGIGADEYLGGYVRHVALVNKNKKILNKSYPSYKELFLKNSSSTNLSTTYYNLINRSKKRSELGSFEIKKIFQKQKTILNSAASTDFKISLPSLLRIEDRINMHFGIESRSPFLDYRLIEFAYKLPDDLKIKIFQDKIVTKYILREAFQKQLPKEIYLRKDKIGFPSPVSLWLAKELNYAVHNSYNILKNTPLKNSFKIEKSNKKFSRKNWHLVQFAAWYLLFFKNMSVSNTSKVLFSNPMEYNNSVNKETKIIRSTIAYESTPFTVREDVITQEGQERLYSVIERPNTVIVIPIINHDRIILLKQFRHPTASYSWELPMGGIDEGEATEEAAIRELAEETDIQLQTDSLIELGKFNPAPALTSQQVTVFTVNIEKEKIENLDKEINVDDIEEMKTVSIDEALTMVSAGEITDGFTISGLLFLKNHLTQNA